MKNDDHSEEVYCKLEEMKSRKPFTIEFGNEQLHYYLKYQSSDEEQKIVRNAINQLKNCRHCGRRCRQQAFLFGPEEYAIPFWEEEPLFDEIFKVRRKCIQID